MKKIYTIVVFTLAFFFFILGRLINLKVFGTDFFNAPNGERYNQLNLDIYLPILFIIIGILFRLGLFNKLFDSLDHKKIEQKRKLLEWEESQKQIKEKELLSAQQNETNKLLERQSELEKFKDLNFSSVIIDDLEKRTNKAGTSLITAGNQFIYSIVLTVITLIITTLISINSRKISYEIIIFFSLFGSLISFILIISAITNIKEAGRLLKSKKDE
jgi:fumarate reductase subunit D